MTDPVPGLLNGYDISPEEKKSIQMQNLWGALLQGGMGLMAAGGRVSDGQRAQLLMQSAQPFANMGAMNQAMMQSASREKLNAAAAQRLAQQDQAMGDIRKMADDPEFQQSLAALNPAQRALVTASMKKGDIAPALTMMTPKKATEADLKRAEILRAVGGDQEAADRISAGVQKMVVGPDGQPYVVNVATGQVMSGTVGNKPMTEGQSNAALYADRMRNSEPIIINNSAAGQNTFDKLKAQVPGVGNYLVSEGFQKYDQARRDFINATLRRESGAVISDAEFDNANKQYFPQPGDAPDVLKQKEQNRRIAIEGISRAAGPSYKPTQAAQPQQSQGSSLLDEARKAIAAGAPRDAVAARLRERGIDPGGL
jgi:hypothetical protein